MALGILGKPLVVNPELEALRDKGLQEDDKGLLDEAARQLVHKTSRIHAGFLFNAPKTLQNLVLYICEAQDSIADPGWKALGHQLGMSVLVLMAIKNHNLADQDPAYNTLLAYAQHDSATVGKIVEALYAIGRLDIISRMEHELGGLADQVIAQHEASNVNTEVTSDYGSQEGLADNIIRPPVLPAPPFIFKNIKTCDGFLTDTTTPPPYSLQQLQEIHTPHVEHTLQYTALPCSPLQAFKTKEILVMKSNRNTNDSVSNMKKKVYGKKILLTFAMDGEKMSKTVCEVFRRQRQEFDRIGVVVLSEHFERVSCNPHQFIGGAFHQVDYVCPILTPGYIETITGKTQDIPSTGTHMDASYAKYIFTLMNNYFISNGCINDKVRCIIPDQLVISMQKNLLFSGPIFTTWTRSSELEELAVKLLKSGR